MDQGGKIMTGFYSISKFLEGRDIEYRSQASGKQYKGRVRKVIIKDDERRLDFYSGESVSVYPTANISIKVMEG